MKKPIKSDYLTCNQVEYHENLLKYYEALELYIEYLEGKSKPSEEIEQVINYLNKVVNKKFSPKTKETIKLVGARLKQYSVEEAKKVIDIKSKQWLGNEKMSLYLCPSTLFAEANFEKYFNEAPVEKKVQLGFEVEGSDDYKEYVKEQKAQGNNFMSYKEFILKTI